jgi:hypothetical protein
LGNPINTWNIMVTQQQIQLGGMFLDMPHAVELQLQVTNFHPIKRASLARFLIS